MSRRAAPLAVLLALVLGVVLPRTVAAEDPTTAKVRLAADAVLQATGTGDAAGLARLAAQDDPDPWLVADALFARGRLDAAKAFAKAAPRPDVEALPRYLDSLDGTADDAEARARLSRANAAMAARDAAASLAGVEPAPSPTAAAVLHVRFATLRGFSLATLGRLAEAAPVLYAAGQAAEQLGWHARAFAAYDTAAGMAFEAGIFALARDGCTRCLAVHERRARPESRAVPELEGRLGDALRALGDHAQAIAVYQRALARFEAIGDREWTAYVSVGLGNALTERGDHAAAIQSFERAIPQLEATKDKARLSSAFLTRGNAHESSGKEAEARSDYRRALALFEELGDQAGVAGALINLGLLAQRAGSHDEAVGLLERGLGFAQTAGATQFEGNALGGLIEVSLARGEVERTITDAERLVAIAEALKDPHRAGWALWQVGQLQVRRSEFAAAAVAFGRAVPYFEAAGSRQQAVEARMLQAYALGVAGDWGPVREVGARELAAARSRGEHKLVGEIEWAMAAERSAAFDLAASRAGFVRAREAFLAAGDAARAGEMFQEIASTYCAQGDTPKALATYDEALRASEAAGDMSAFAATLRKMGLVHLERGDLLKSQPLFERSLGIYERLGSRYGEASVLHLIGIAEGLRGEHAKALATKERALALHQAVGDKTGAAQMLCNIGTVYGELGDRERAMEWYRRALAAQEEVGDRLSQAITLVNLGNQHVAADELEEAARCFDRALELRRQLGREPGISLARWGHATLAKHRKDWAGALEVYEAILPAIEAGGDRRMVAGVLEAMAEAHAGLGDTSRALQLLDRANRTAEKLGSVPQQVSALGLMARLRLKAGDAGRAIDAAHRAVLLLKGVVGGLGEEQGAVAREQYSTLFDTGLAAAAAAEDPAEAVFFLESGRAGSLLEALGARAVTRAAALPEALRTAERDARAAEAAALLAYTKASERGDLAVERARRADLDAARAKVQEVIERIQRDEKRAQLWYPAAAPVEDIQALLGPDESLVLYGLAAEGDAHAVVLTRAEARIVTLGPTSAVAEACEALDPDTPEVDPTPAFERLAALLVAPLALAPEAKRVFVSPEGPLSYVPFAAILPDREVAYVASGSTYAELIGQRSLSGEKVLALADPDYKAKFEPTSLQLYALDQRGGAARGATRGRTFVPLPGTRTEAEAVGDVKRFGADASEAGLREVLGKHPGRWRSVHFACHGLVDPERPTLSSLVLTPDAGNDGFLTALEVLRMEIPADLVVLSACETGRGKIVKGEGLVGLTRAFMYAGAPRVVCSLWKVDDDATRALMTKFYEVWKGGKVSTAAALRQAQEHVRSQPKWKHPYYWAAWVLWGLP